MKPPMTFHDHDRAVLHHVERSLAFRFVATVAERVGAAAGESRVLALVRRRAADARALDLAMQIRCAGVLVATAALTHELLLIAAPSQAVPAAGHAFVAFIGIAAASAAWLAPWLAVAWTSRSRS